MNQLAIAEKTRLGESVSGTLWQMNEPDERRVLTVMQHYELPEIIARMLVMRGIPLEQTESFLNPTIKDWLPDPMHLLDMDKAATRVVKAITNQETIAIFGDYDVDGATSTSVLTRYFRSLGANVIYYIPDRIVEGYGPNSNAMQILKDKGASLCITVDCGTLSYEPLAFAASIGLDVVVIDHHLSAENLPQAHAIVNPNRFDETSEHGYMAAVGVSFLLAVAVNKLLKDQQFFVDKQAPDLLQLLDMVALGTVCDVVPLKKANRAFVAQGLKMLKKRQNIGLNALSDVAAINETPGVYHLGFILGPRINAGGRVAKADFGTRLLTTHDVDEAYEIALQLQHFNGERKTIEQLVLDEAMAQAENMEQDTPLIMVAGEGWHPGVIGIVAGRLKERYHRPTAVISLDHGIGKASARSITGVDFGSAVVAAVQEGVLMAGGGHAMAAGFTVAQDKLQVLKTFLSERFASGVAQHGQKKLYIDGSLSLSAITQELVQLISMVGPFGMGNPEPQFMFPNAYVIKVDILSGQHLRIILGDNSSDRRNSSIKAMAFRCVDTPLGQTLINARGKHLNIVGKLRLNHWQGISKPELLIEDVG